MPLLDTKLVGELEGTFNIPSYQRGYRWKKPNIEMLLNDIYENGSESYCLQPIVVKKLKESNYELIDGQQRLTTIYIILKYIKSILPRSNPKFSINYDIRTDCTEFLETFDESLRKKNIDFYHMYNALETIDEWFKSTENGDESIKAINIYKYFSENVNIIWYEVDSNKNSIELFTRLNLGKIPLTNAELVKALFLSMNNGNLTQEKQLEIATSWDNIEKELHNDSLWFFLTNENPDLYQTRIELIFNMIAKKNPSERDKLYTFFHFTKQLKENKQTKIWDSIEDFYYILKEWYENRDLYHKVGYLVASGAQIENLKEESRDLTKSDFIKTLDSKISETLGMTSEMLQELTYDNLNNKAKIKNLLLLFNVESVRLIKDSTELYPFNHYKKQNWSLEHIHAQNSEGLNKQADQQLWLKLQKKSLEDLVQVKNNNTDEIIEVIDTIDKLYDKINQIQFDDLFNKITIILSESSDKSDIDLVSNMALLSIGNNAALNNSTFDVKRNKILEIDKNGEYIPICTRRVFLKYYSSSENTHLQFWGKNDREAYLDAMIGTDGKITPYLKKTEEEL